MHELASMAALKAQEMTFLPPPPPDMVTSETQDKVSWSLSKRCEGFPVIDGSHLNFLQCLSRRTARNEMEARVKAP